MTPGDVARVLAKAAAFDQRTVGEADILAWHEAIGDLDAADALAAVARHYRDSTERIMPAHVRKLARSMREDRRGREMPTAPRALPGRYEDDVTRDLRVRAGVAQCREVLGPVMDRLRAARTVAAREEA